MKYLIPFLFISSVAFGAETTTPPPTIPKTVTLTQVELQEYIQIAIQNYLFQQNVQKSKGIVDKIESAFK